MRRWQWGPSAAHIHMYPVMGQFAECHTQTHSYWGKRKENILRGVQRFSWQHSPSPTSHSIRIRGTLPSKHQSSDFTSSLHQPNEFLMQSHGVPSVWNSPRCRAGEYPALAGPFAALRVPPARALEQESGGSCWRNDPVL